MVLSIGIQQSQSCWSSLVVQTRGLVYAQWLLACMSKNASKWGDEETGRLCVYICMWGRFAFAFFFPSVLSNGYLICSDESNPRFFHCMVTHNAFCSYLIHLVTVFKGDLSMWSHWDSLMLA